MKGRSHRLPPSKPPDDWGDGSWTVDCSCGVTFDDGEEMVSCDECGVWVHTRCGRFVHGEDSFACHKCKAGGRRRTHHDSTEETEVAQLLIELPNKAADPGPGLPMPPLLPRRPHVPIEDRVHVHGIPGGDPALFQGLSPVCSQQLWKCTGHIPKKFNFKWPVFDEEEEGGDDNPDSKGADVLFSLSKEIVPYAPVKSTFESRTSQKGVKKHRMEKVSGCSGRSQGSAKKERNSNHVLGAHSNKQRKEELGEGKKRARGVPDRASADTERRGSVPLVTMNKTGFCNDGGMQIAESDIPDAKSEDNKEHMAMEGLDDGSKHSHIFVVKSSRGGEILRQRSMLAKPEEVEKIYQLESVVSQEGRATSKEPAAVEEDVSKALHGSKQYKDENHFEGDVNESSCSIVVESQNTKPAIDTLRNSYVVGQDKPKVSPANGSISLCSKLDKIEVKLEEGDDQGRKFQDTDHLLQHPQKPITHLSENLPENENNSTLPSDEIKSQDARRDSEASQQTCDKIMEGKVNITSEPKPHGQVVESTGSTIIKKDSLESRQSSKFIDGPMKLGCFNRSHPTPNMHKSVVGLGKASSASALSRTSASGNYKSLRTAASSTVAKAVHLTKQQRVKVTTSTVGKVENETTVEESFKEVSRQMVNDHPKDSECSGSKSSNMSTASCVSSKHALQDSKEKLLPPTPKVSTTEKATILPSSGGASASSQTQKDSVQIKLISSGSCHKNEKINQPVCQSSLKGFNHSTSMHPPAPVNAATTLSDEELALLLHQELNSSPRVPRVPRVRQAAGMQLATQSATIMLKRSSSGGKDQVSVSKRKSKDNASRDLSRNPNELTDETKIKGRVLSSPDQKHWESAYITDGSAKMDGRNSSPDITTSVKTNSLIESTGGTNSCLSSFEASGQKGLTVWSSSWDVLDDVGTPSRRTLPGLIDEILSKGRRMTYEELCEAVRPHWLNLRKPNGERYAYSSHSHAVLDCLRNRNEWAHLIDRGPKTNSSKRRRKLDSDTPTFESENEEPRNQAPREAEDRNVESHREDFPKGKRKARKPRRLQPQGRGIREPRKRHNQDAGSDDDPAVCSHSSNEVTEGNFSEESQGAGQPAAGDGISSSGSDDTD